MNFPFFHRRGPLEASHDKFYKTEEEGVIASSYSWEDRQPHPNNMGSYDEWANDPEANIAFNVLTDIIAGVGYYTEMPEKDKKGEDVDPEHKNKQIIDIYGETVNLDEDLQEIVLAMLQKGFCPVERVEGYDLKILPPETFYIYKTKRGDVYRYTQERSKGDVIASWEDPHWKSRLGECKEAYEKEQFKELINFESSTKPGNLEDIILFFHRKTTSWPYGKSLVEPIGPLLDDRAQMNKDMPKAIHRWAYPIPVISTKGPKAAVQTAFVDRDSDNAVFIGNVVEGEFNMDTLQIDPQARFIPYIELIYYQICEGLHAPLLLYLKNATEASATVMMESVDRLVNGVQRYIKRRVEKYLFEPQVGEPVPRLVWGQPKTGLEEITLTDVAQVLPFLTRNQQLDLLQQFGIELPEPEQDPIQTQPQTPFSPFQQQKPQPQVPVEQILEKLNDVETGLTIIETNFVENRLGITEAMRLADRTITVHMKRIYPNSWKSRRDAKFEEFARKLIPVKDGKVYHVAVNE